MLLPYPVSLVSGLTSVTTNLGKIENRGIEATLGVTLVDNEDLTWDFDLSYAYNENKVTDLGGNPEGIDIPGFGTTSIYLNMPVGIQTIPIWVGVDPASGQDIYKGLDGNNYTVSQAAAQAGSLNNFLNANRVPFGSPYPDFTGSFSSSLNYKNWYMNTLWNFAVGQT